MSGAAEAGARLVTAGAPIVRLRISMRMLHPLWTGWTSVWEASGALQRDSLAPHGMGEAVNLAARIEKLCRPLGEGIVLSERVAQASGLECRDLDLHAVAGWEERVRVFGVGDAQ